MTGRFKPGVIFSACAAPTAPVLRRSTRSARLTQAGPVAYSIRASALTTCPPSDAAAGSPLLLINRLDVRGFRARSGCRRRTAAEESRRLQPLLIGIVREQQPVAPDAIDDFARHRLAQCRAAPAPAQTSLRPGELLADVGRAVHDDGARDRLVVEPGLQPLQSQRVTVLSAVRVCCFKQAEARLMAFRIVRKGRREIVAAAPAVRHQLLVQERAGAEIEHPQALRGRWLRV